MLWLLGYVAGIRRSIKFVMKYFINHNLIIFAIETSVSISFSLSLYLRRSLSVSVRVRTLFSMLSSLCGSSLRNFTASTSTLSTARIRDWRAGNSPARKKQCFATKLSVIISWETVWHLTCLRMSVVMTYDWESSRRILFEGVKFELILYKDAIIAL